jgi:predicted ATPase
VITSLAVRNYKRFTDTAFDLRPLTVLTGLNGTGKSTVVQTLLLVRQLADLPGTEVVQLNGPYGLALGEAQEIQERDLGGSMVEVELTSDSLLEPRTYRFAVPDGRALHLVVADQQVQPLPELSREGSGFTYLCAERLGPRDQLGVSAEHPDRVGVGVQGEYTAQVLAVHDSKQVREPLHSPDTEVTQGVMTLRTQTEAWASAIIRPIRISAEWPAGITASTIRFHELTQYGLSDAIRPTNMGFGFSYALPIIVAGLLTQPGDLLIVENPEAHLHPGGQSKLGRFLARVAGSGVQVLLETHSDHVMNGVRLGVAEEHSLASEAAIIHYFNEDSAHSTPLEITPRGELTSWPKGFFDQIEHDLGRLSRARRGR